MVGLIRPYLKYSAYHYGVAIQHETASVTKALAIIQEQWMHDSVLSSAWERLYTTWEKNIRIYLTNQRSWNGFDDDFDWNIGNIEPAARVISFMECFGVEVSTNAIAEIRKKSVTCLEEYKQKSREVEDFWFGLDKFEVFRLESYP